MEREPILFREPILIDKQNICPYDIPYGYVYLTTNLLNGNRYIGQHCFNKPHIDSNYHGSGRLISRAIKKFGRNNFVSKVLFWAATKEELDCKEIEYIEAFHAVERKTFYNIWYDASGFISGEKHPFYGRVGKDAIAYGFSPQNVGQCVLGRTSSSAGYRWCKKM